MATSKNAAPTGGNENSQNAGAQDPRDQQAQTGQSGGSDPAAADPNRPADSGQAQGSTQQ
jgi:hypothetical protein